MEYVRHIPGPERSKEDLVGFSNSPFPKHWESKYNQFNKHLANIFYILGTELQNSLSWHEFNHLQSENDIRSRILYKVLGQVFTWMAHLNG